MVIFPADLSEDALPPPAWAELVMAAGERSGAWRPSPGQRVDQVDTQHPSHSCITPRYRAGLCIKKAQFVLLPDTWWHFSMWRLFNRPYIPVVSLWGLHYNFTLTLSNFMVFVHDVTNLHVLWHICWQTGFCFCIFYLSCHELYKSYC